MTIKLYNEDTLLGTHGPFKKVEFRNKNLYGVNDDSFALVAQSQGNGKWKSLDSDMPVTHFDIKRD